MSLDSSRSDSLPVNIDKYRSHIINSWKIVSATDNMYSQHSHKTTMHPSVLNLAGKYLGQYFANTYLDILEVFAGNCISSEIIEKHLTVNSWSRTDIERYKIANTVTTFNKLDSITAVQLFGPRANVLLMISPPFSETNDITRTNVNLGYGDYFACKDFIAQCNTTKYIVFIGELGASDGSSGMYQYLITHPQLKITLRKIISSGKDILGGKMEKEVFVFKIIV